MPGRMVLGVLFGILLSTIAAAETIYVPEELKPWVKWVQDEDQQHNCPVYNNSAKYRYCGWPGKLELEVTQDGLRFKQHWKLYAKSWVPLPGSDGFWPQRVLQNEEPALIVQRKSLPYVRLMAGDYQLQGTIPWNAVPESILIPPVTALVSLNLNDNLIQHPKIDVDGRLWFIEKNTQTVDQIGTENTEDKLSIRVYRHLMDDVPFTIRTYIDFEVSGKPREMLLGKVLFDEYEVTQFDTPLPARLETDGRLLVQLRPGQWHIRIDSHHINPVKKLYLENVEDAVWPEEEIWVFQSLPELRQVRVEGPESIDPNQTTLPDHLKQWPAYPMKMGQVMTLNEIRRGDPQPSPNRLTNVRELWMDFDGAGFTVRDTLSGSLNRDWRLNAQNELLLGNLELNGKPQVITQVDDRVGVEIRTGNLNAVALSRLQLDQAAHRIDMPSAGWLHDFDTLNATLNLPVGWRLILVDGVDHASNTWAGSWSVWDIFVVMITIAAILRLRGIIASVISGLALVLIYPEEPTFLYLLLNAVVILTLLSLLPEGKLRHFCRIYASGTALVLMVWLLSFMVTQARLGLYPQLEQPWLQMGANVPQYSTQAMPAAAPVEMSAMDMVMEEAEPLARSRQVKSKPKSSYLSSVSQSNASIDQFDPTLAAQTGPGLPHWKWVSTSLRWSGPVTQQETLTLWLLNPTENRILCWARVLLSALLVFAVLGLSRKEGKWRIQFERAAMARGLVLLFLCSGLIVIPDDSYADIPNKEILTELKNRLAEQDKCVPDCMSIPSAQLNLQDGRLTVQFKVHALQPVYWQIPDSQKQWQLDTVLLNGEAHYLKMSGNKDTRFHTSVPKGEHQLVISGLVDTEKEFQLNFSELPYNLKVQVKGFQVKGMENGRLVSNSLSFYPTAKVESTKIVVETTLAPKAISGFVKVERDLKLGLNWYVETRIKRLAPKQGSIHVEIPLLEGESVTSQDIHIENGIANVSLESGQNQLVWFSSLDKSSIITLQAADTGNWVENWIVTPSPLWNLSSEGISPVKQSSQVAQWRPQWRPYPGEQVKLKITKPVSVKGATKTLDQVVQVWRPGDRESQSNLRVHLSTSKGTEQRIHLPQDARVKQLMVNDQQRAVEENNPNLVVSLNPGDHWVDVSWSQSGGLSSKAETPSVALGDNYVNYSLEVKVPRDRWILFVGGPAMGPAVLFWGVLSVMVLVGIGLGRVRSLPLRSWHWVLLILGLSAGWIEAIIPVAIWFFLLEKRKSRWADKLNRVQFNTVQVLLALFSVFTILLLVGSIPNGLLGSPDMGITGNGSTLYSLNWFVDRGQDTSQSAWFISLPIWVYRAIMLVWSLWLSVYLLRWLKWGWQCYTHNGHWRSATIETGEK